MIKAEKSQLLLYHTSESSARGAEARREYHKKSNSFFQNVETENYLIYFSFVMKISNFKLMEKRIFEESEEKKKKMNE